jgi:hypothetical protein
MTETTTPEPTSGSAQDAASVEPKAKSSGTPIALWALYVLGLVAATVLVASLLFVAFAYAVTGNGGTGVDVSVPALVIWLGLVIAAGGTFAWRRWGGR